MIKIRRTVITLLAILLIQLNVFANLPTVYDNQLEKTLATGLVAEQTVIDLKGVNVPFDYLNDTIRKVRNQNPFMPIITSMIYQGDKLIVTYQENNHQEKSKQTLAKAQEIVNSKGWNRIQDPVTKAKGIYQYLKHNAIYDDKAAKATDVKVNRVPTGYEDSFIPYGVLINGTGVCGSYAMAYKLLADLSGLETIIVTGYAPNGQYHAWNKVLIGNEWYNVDVTNNERNTTVPRMVHLISDERVEGIGYQEDKAYWTDYDIGKFKATSSKLDTTPRVNGTEELKRYLQNIKGNNKNVYALYNVDIANTNIISNNVKLPRYSVGSLGNLLIIEGK